MKAQRYRQIAAGAVVAALEEAGRQLGPIDKIEVDGVKVDASEALAVYKAEQSKAEEHRGGGKIAQTVDLITGRTAGSLAKAVDSFSRRTERLPFQRVIPKRQIASLTKKVKLDPERVSKKSMVEVRFADGRIEPFAVEALNVAATFKLQRASLLSATGGAIVPIVGAAIPAATALSCFTAAVVAVAQGDMPTASASAASGAKQVILTGTALLPFEPITPLAAVVDAKNLETLKAHPTVANIVHLGESPLTEDGQPILPRRIPNLHMRPAIRVLLISAIPEAPDKSGEAQEDFLTRLEVLRKTGSVRDRDAQTLRTMLEEWGGFADPELFRKALNEATSPNPKAQVEAQPDYDKVTQDVFNRLEGNRAALKALEQLVADPAYQSVRVASQDRTSVLRQIAAYGDGPSATAVARAVHALIKTKSFQRPARTDAAPRRKAEQKTRRRMLRMVGAIADMSVRGTDEDRTKAHNALQLLTGDKVRWSFDLAVKSRDNFDVTAPPRYFGVVQLPGAAPRFALNRGLVAPNNTRVSDRGQQKRLLQIGHSIVETFGDGTDAKLWSP